jgi:hypothetical protein
MADDRSKPTPTPSVPKNPSTPGGGQPKNTPSGRDVGGPRDQR